MKNKISIFDYDADWALKEHYNEKKPVEGYLILEDAIRFYGTLGIDGIELSRRYWENVETSYLKKLVGDAGLPVVSYIFYEDMVVPPGKKLQSAIDGAKKQMDRTVELGASLAMIIPAVYKDNFKVDEQRRWLIEGLARCAEYARALNITLAIENIDDPPVRPFASKASDCVSICKEINSPSFGLIFDPGCCLFLEENPLMALKTMAPYVIHVHVKNSRPFYSKERVCRFGTTVSGKKLTGTVLDAGLVSISEILNELNNMKYRGYIMIEYLGESDPRITLPYNVGYLRRQMKYLDEKN